MRQIDFLKPLPRVLLTIREREPLLNVYRWGVYDLSGRNVEDFAHLHEAVAYLQRYGKIDKERR